MTTPGITASAAGAAGSCLDGVARSMKSRRAMFLVALILALGGTLPASAAEAIPYASGELVLH
jgi:hypothetical protein